MQMTAWIMEHYYCMYEEQNQVLLDKHIILRPVAILLRCCETALEPLSKCPKAFRRQKAVCCSAACPIPRSKSNSKVLYSGT